jgi:hypothetical protein
MDSHDLGTELDRFGHSEAFVRIGEKLHRVEGASDEYGEDGSEIVVISVSADTENKP